MTQNTTSVPTILEIVDKSTEYFKSKNIENARLDAQLLVGHVLNLKRMDLYLNFDKPLSAKEVDTCRDFVKRRGLREPLQHILGHVLFRNLTLNVDKRALIPRKETEQIVDILIKNIPQSSTLNILEIGTGAGPICLSLLSELPLHNIYACDISNDAIALTNENAVKNNVVFKNLLFVSDMFSKAPDVLWDVIISNPPYIAQKVLASLEPEVKTYDPELALVGGIEGWEFPLKLMQEAFNRTNDTGMLLMEIGHDQGVLLSEKAREIGWNHIDVQRDLNQFDRFILLRK